MKWCALVFWTSEWTPARSERVLRFLRPLALIYLAAAAVTAIFTAWVSVAVLAVALFNVGAAYLVYSSRLYGWRAREKLVREAEDADAALQADVDEGRVRLDDYSSGGNWSAIRATHLATGTSCLVYGSGPAARQEALRLLAERLVHDRDVDAEIITLMRRPKAGDGRSS